MNINIINRQIGKLTVLKLSYINGSYKYYLCQCSCGNTKEIRMDHLISEKINSCGCIKKKYHPQETSARAIWRSCYNDCDFNTFVVYSQKDCHYCGIQPSKKINVHIYYLDNHTKNKDDGFFIYNGLDRIDSNKLHIIDNIVPCCYYCNSSKLDRSYSDFLLWINKVFNHKNINNKNNTNTINNIININKHQISAANSIWKRNYKDLPFDYFLQLSQNNCHYCNSTPINRSIHTYNKQKNNKDKYTFIYNGLDRIDNNIGHSIENVVSCCVYCNKSKLDRPLNDFYNWIDKLYYNIKDNDLENISIYYFINKYKEENKNITLTFPLNIYKVKL